MVKGLNMRGIRNRQAKVRDRREGRTMVLEAKVLFQKKKKEILLVHNCSCLHYFTQAENTDLFLP